MTMPFSYVEAPTLIGGWPILPNFSTPGDAALIPRVLRSRAAILGVQKETAGGFDVKGLSFWVEVDGNGTRQITFAAGAGVLDLAGVVAGINLSTQAWIGKDIAKKDGAFLKLESPIVGASSYLRVFSDYATSPNNCLHNLGLFAETTSHGGELESSSQYDPDRQIIYPGQLIMAEGETV